MWVAQANQSFALAASQTYCGRHFDDRNLDGVQQADEPSRADVRVNVIDRNSVVRFALTGPNGEFCVQSIPVGQHTVRFDDQPTSPTTISVSGTGIQTVAAGRNAEPISVLIRTGAPNQPTVPTVTTTTIEVINPGLPLGRTSTTLAGRRPTAKAQAPVTVAPPTVAPTTVASTTRPSTTVAPTTRPTTTVVPTTRPTTTAAPQTTTSNQVAFEAASMQPTKPSAPRGPLPKTGSSSPATVAAALFAMSLGLFALAQERGRYRPRHAKP